MFLFDAAQLTDAEKMRLLLRKLSTDVYNRYAGLILPTKTHEIRFKETLERLNKLFGSTKSRFSRRLDCMNLSKSEGDDYVTHASKVNTAVEASKFSEMSVDQWKCLVFIMSLKGQTDADIRHRLLSKVGNTTGANLTLEDLLTEINHMKSLAADASEVVVKQEPGVNIVRSKTQQKRGQSSNTSQTTGQRTDQPRRPCGKCGGTHFVKDCSYQNHKCTKCNRVGHKDDYCSFNRPPKQTVAEQKMVRVSATTTELLNRRKYVQVLLSEVPVTMQFDLGADFSLISEGTWKKIGAPDLAETKFKTFCASNQLLPILGDFFCDLTLLSTGQNGCGRMSVVKNSQLNLFGLDWHNRFNLDELPLHVICATVQQPQPEVDPAKVVMKEFPTVFSGKLGHCTDFKIHLPLRSDFEGSPVYLPARRVGYNALPMIRDEMRRLEGEGVLVKVDFSS